jgi:hypothetical protein
MAGSMVQALLAEAKRISGDAVAQQDVILEACAQRADDLIQAKVRSMPALPTRGILACCGMHGQVQACSSDA